MRALMLVLGLFVTAALAQAERTPVKREPPKEEAFVAKCRSQCAAQLTSDHSRDSCLEQEECLRCWASCQAFQSDHFIRDYCERNKACTAGCRQACRFYLAPGGPAEVTEDHPEVVLVDHVQGALPETPAYSIVDGEEAGWSGAAGLGVELPGGAEPQTDTEARWPLRLAAMRFGSPLVSATVAWESRGAGVQYLATWELLSGGLRGHLVSADTSASLPLWPDEQYLVQVFSNGAASQPLLVSTSRSAAPPESASQLSPSLPDPAEADVSGQPAVADRSRPPATPLPESAPEEGCLPRALRVRLLALLLLALGCAAGVFASWCCLRRLRQLAAAADADPAPDSDPYSETESVCDSVLDADAEAGGERRTLLARGLLRLPPQVLADPRSAPVFTVPRIKR
ncbi:uncharacterized protein LOC119093574 [Pollicipes pollicipes]|uniref:uncharacterized protein LOC119093574 n=1 Tax=Pollicipes pollicipes TaxID=41117 RepID=UPI0018858011|nr:uncharacterized protein LOC119093574 [Pollicipes pollicipes]